MNRLTSERARKLFRYDPLTGKLFWKVDKSRGIHAGQEAGCLSARKYRIVQVDGKTYYTHRIIWLLVYGYWPKEIDHYDGDGLNNRMDNLREVIHSENCRNEKKRKDNTSGITGVYWHKTCAKWTARIGVDGYMINLGHFYNFQNAVETRKVAEKQYGFSPNHGKEKIPF